MLLQNQGQIIRIWQSQSSTWIQNSKFDQSNIKRSKTAATGRENNNSVGQKPTWSAKIPDLFQDNNAIKKKNFTNPYTATRIQLRNILSNISYCGINQQNFDKKNFAFDIYTLPTKSLNSFSLDRKLNDQNNHEMIHMLWKECMPAYFYKFISLE